MNHGHLAKAALELTEALNRVADQNLPGELAGIVKLHAGIAVASAFIPIPGADMAAAAANIWTMYVRINKELNLPFGENVVKSLAAGVVTNLAGAAASLLVVASVMKFVPGIGSLGGAAVMAGTIYAITIASGIVYMRAVAMLLRRQGAASEADLKAAADDILRDKAAMQSILKNAKEEYNNNKGK